MRWAESYTATSKINRLPHVTAASSTATGYQITYPGDLTVARTWRDTIAFDHDSNPATEAFASSMKSIVQSANGYVNTDDRVDIRYGQGPDGELYLLSKRNNMVYLVRNSLLNSNLND